MIAEQYINEGIRIRKEYIRNLREILKLEPAIIEKRSSFDKIREQMENVVYSDLNAVRKTLDLNGRLMEMEKEIKTIQDAIRPFYEAIERLESDSDRLYLAIMEKYPGMTGKEIEFEIMSRVDE